MNRPPVSDKILLHTIENLTINIGQQIEEKGRGAFLSHHEMLGAITEEYSELIDAVRQNNPSDVISELFDVAVACAFSIASMLEAQEQIKLAKQTLEEEMTEVQGSED